MECILGKVTGVDDAIISLYMSKHNYDPAMAKGIREVIHSATDYRGFFINQDTLEGTYERMINPWLEKVTKYGMGLGYKRSHETILRFIDISIEITGLHRGAMDDFDSHARRFDNRIIRSSSRISGVADKINPGYISEYYKGKIIFGDMEWGHTIERVIVSPDNCEPVRWAKFIWNGFAYVREDLWDDQDVQRGTYPLALSSDCICKCNFAEIRHVYALRNKRTHVHPELQDAMESLAQQVEQAIPILGKGMAHEIINGSWIPVYDVQLIPVKVSDASDPG